jgi:hypothetical protein
LFQIFDHPWNVLAELQKFVVKYGIEDLGEMNNFLHRSFFRFGIDLELKFSEISRLEFNIVSSFNFEFG